MGAAFDGLHEDEVFDPGDRVEPLGSLQIMEILLDEFSIGNPSGTYKLRSNTNFESFDQRPLPAKWLKITD
jgi:hypothetical protein